MDQNQIEGLGETQEAAILEAPIFDDGATEAGTPSVEEDTPRQRMRFIYEKGEAIKFISHQDEFRLWERSLRRADLPLLYKQGFNPQPHLVFASPLGVGNTGANEPIDIILSPPVALEEARALII